MQTELISKITNEKKDLALYYGIRSTTVLSERARAEFICRSSWERGSNLVWQISAIFLEHRATLESKVSQLLAKQMHKNRKDAELSFSIMANKNPI